MVSRETLFHSFIRDGRSVVPQSLEGTLFWNLAQNSLNVSEQVCSRPAGPRGNGGSGEENPEKKKKKTKTGWGNAGSEMPSLIYPPILTPTANRKKKIDGKIHPKDPQSQGAPTNPGDLERARRRAKPRLSPNQKPPQLLNHDNTDRGADKTQAFKR